MCVQLYQLKSYKNISKLRCAMHNVEFICLLAQSCMKINVLLFLMGLTGTIQILQRSLFIHNHPNRPKLPISLSFHHSLHLSIYSHLKFILISHSPSPLGVRATIPPHWSRQLATTLCLDSVKRSSKCHVSWACLAPFQFILHSQ